MHIEQPQMEVFEEDPQKKKIAIFLDAHPIVPEQILTEPQVWVHEFVEITLMRIIDNFVFDSMKRFTMVRLEGGQYWMYQITIPHIITSISCLSFFDGKPIYEDQFWQILKTSISLKEYKRRTEANMRRWGWDCVP